MYLSKISIKNYRLLLDAELDIDEKITLLVGRNNTAKTSCLECIEKVISGKSFNYNDYPLSKRKQLQDLTTRFMGKEISYKEFSKSIPKIVVEFTIDYSADGPEDNLGALSPFIIDVDEETTTAIIRIESRIKMEEETFFNLFEYCFYKNGDFLPDMEEGKIIFKKEFSKIFGNVIYAVNPKNSEDTQIKDEKEIEELFPKYKIPAERILGEDGSQNNNSLSTLISRFFSVKDDDLKPEVAAQIKNLIEIVNEANKEVQKKSDRILSELVNRTIGFGYPNAEELQLSVNTRLSIDDQIKNNTELAYVSESGGESLPSTYNGLGYKNLIKIEFLLAAFAQELETKGSACIPLLFLEEPESHMHPQMQQTFADYLEDFLDSLTNINVQTLLTTHSSHIANTMEFSKIRYAQKNNQGVVYKNLDVFTKTNPENLDFIRKYLSISRCDMFFADKLIFVEGASERLLIPDMINKCKDMGLFDGQKYKLSEQYYALIEIGGAYAYLFIPFANFLGIPCLILTDLDSIKEGRKKEIVSKGKWSSNSTINRWMKRIKGISESSKTKIDLAEIVALSSDKKTDGKCHIEYQIKENGLCGRSLEEAIMNVNRDIYNISEPVNEDKLTFSEKSKTDFALNLIINNPNYEIPKYIKDGLVWLNNQTVLN